MLPRACANPACRAPFKARAADVKRGWGRFCGKAGKARKQEAETGMQRFRNAPRGPDGLVHPRDLPRRVPTHEGDPRDVWLMDDY